jgi:hypothetical protein
MNRADDAAVIGGGNAEMSAKLAQAPFEPDIK